MATTADSSTNGHQPDDEHEVRARLHRLKDVGKTPGPNHTYSGSKSGEEQSGPPHDEPRHPEDPPRALHQAAREICDPEEIREGLVDTGTTMQAVPADMFEPLLGDLVDGITETRAGAITGPAQVAVGVQLKIVESTGKESEQITRDRAADGNKADRLEQDDVPRVQQQIEDQKAEVADKKQAKEAARQKLDTERGKGYPKGWRVGDLIHWVSLPPWAALVLAAVGLVINTFLLEAPLSSVVNVSQIGAYTLSGGISLTFELASAAAGYVFASLRLPGRAAATVFLAAFAVIIVKLVTGLDALRLYKASGAEVLTSATLASCFVAGLTGYATATYKDYHHHRELALAAGSTLADAIGGYSEAGTAVFIAETKLANLEQHLVDLFSEIERLRDSATRADAAALTREADGIKAAVDADTITAVAGTHVAQEKDAGAWGKASALMAYYKARTEKLPEGDQIRQPTATLAETASATHGLSLSQKLAVAALGAGAAGGFLVSPLLLAIGAGVAAVLLLPWARLGHYLGLRKATATVLPVVPPLDAQADTNNPLYLHLPDHLTPKYDRGDATFGEHQ